MIWAGILLTNRLYLHSFPAAAGNEEGKNKTVCRQTLLALCSLCNSGHQKTALSRRGYHRVVKGRLLFFRFVCGPLLVRGRFGIFLFPCAPYGAITEACSCLFLRFMYRHARKASEPRPARPRMIDGALSPVGGL
jgi:hypothetical protein